MTTTVKVHKFEAAGLGKAPFQFIGCYRDSGPKLIGRFPDGTEQWCGAPGQPMGVCDFCGTAIATCFKIRSADKKEFVVGCECVYKTGDAGLKRAIKPEVNRARREAQQKRDTARIESARQVLNTRTDIVDALYSRPHPYTHLAERGETLGHYVEFLWRNGSNSGHVRAARIVERIAKEFSA